MKILILSLFAMVALNANAAQIDDDAKAIAAYFGAKAIIKETGPSIAARGIQKMTKTASPRDARYDAELTTDQLQMKCFNIIMKDTVQGPIVLDTAYSCAVKAKK